MKTRRAVMIMKTKRGDWKRNAFLREINRCQSVVAKTIYYIKEIVSKVVFITL